MINSNLIFLILLPILYLFDFFYGKKPFKTYVLNGFFNFFKAEFNIYNKNIYFLFLKFSPVFRAIR